ncbi:hypothetical protein [Xenorhabdus griffiniae]|uniref:ASCH domain-containing protein n=1 Tax=Xenorhabdus griffiniae TaxID=351672 RepID=A0ABY9XM56_9GAMM|nr:hypothetical protein [Xenorhabdus griffiniae]MBD1229259.1 hypothetical protein [Xenorhabdus griffiniae]MBE8589006.1 hypothetical protein [Xenorhabdus griffiniae]WMV74000.1 hypothetical protein QL128_08400 [Xenorhabdus griffiniae]WNH03680.1 hypothetical protein QL112_008405 [Xenorhabdus griffiniae]
MKQLKFNGEMIDAILAGTKTQTRRPIKPQPQLDEQKLSQMGAIAEGFTLAEVVNGAWQAGFIDVGCPYGEFGDITNFTDKDGNIKGRLEITDVRVERLQDISRKDAIAEGGPPSHTSIDAVSQQFGFPDFSRSWFAQTWWSIYDKESWAANPWVWVIEFRRIE